MKDLSSVLYGVKLVSPFYTMAKNIESTSKPILHGLHWKVHVECQKRQNYSTLFHFKFAAMALLFQVSLNFHSACHSIFNGDKFVRVHSRRIINIAFLKRSGFSIQKLHSKSVLFAVPLNFLNKPLFRVWPTIY